MFHGGGIAGIGSHQYIHNTPADYRYGIKRPPLTVSDTSFYTHSAFRAYEPQLGYLATVLVPCSQRRYDVPNALVKRRMIADDSRFSFNYHQLSYAWSNWKTNIGYHEELEQAQNK